MATNTEAYKELKEKITELRRQATEEGRAVFRDGFEQFFKDHPVLEQVSWTQYTPYFNDGDTCTFSAQNDSIYINGTDYAEHEFSKYGADRCTDEVKKAAGLAILDFLAVFDNEDYLNMFGDHARVTVTKEGIEVEEYEHD